jgi:hypothetical protein
MDIHHFFIEDKILSKINMTHREIGNFRELRKTQRNSSIRGLYSIFNLELKIVIDISSS